MDLKSGKYLSGIMFSKEIIYMYKDLDGGGGRVVMGKVGSPNG